MPAIIHLPHPLLAGYPQANLYIDQLVCGMPQAERQRRRLLILKTTHIDDSGSDRLPKYYVLAGYLSTVPRWKTFADEWAACLASGPRSLAYFKMREAHRLQDQFRLWAAPERDEKIAELVAVIERNVECQVVCTASKHDYDLYMKGRVAPTEMDNPYFFLFIAAVNSLVKRENKHHNRSRIDFVFDRQLDVERTARLVYGDIERFSGTALGGGRISREKIGGLSYVDDKSVNPLQAADLLAWTEHRRLEYPQEPRPACVRSLDSIETVRGDMAPHLMRLTVRITNEVLKLKYPLTHPGLRLPKPIKRRRPL